MALRDTLKQLRTQAGQILPDEIDSDEVLNTARSIISTAPGLRG